AAEIGDMLLVVDVVEGRLVVVGHIHADEIECMSAHGLLLGDDSRPRSSPTSTAGRGARALPSGIESREGDPPPGRRESDPLATQIEVGRQDANPAHMLVRQRIPIKIVQPRPTTQPTAMVRGKPTRSMSRPDPIRPIGSP